MAEDKCNSSDKCVRMRRLAEQLAERLSCQERLFCKIRNLPVSQQKQKLLDAVREEREQLLAGRCEVLEGLCGEYETRIGQLQKENNSLREKNRELEYKLRRSRYELNKALGIRPAENPKAESGESTQDKDESGDGKKKKGQGKRGAPEGHRGATRPVPGHVDREEVFPAPQVCKCGCARVSPLDDFDVRYIEDIPPVSKIVTREI